MASMYDIGIILKYPAWQQTAYENLANAIIELAAEDYIGELICNYGSIDNFNGRLKPGMDSKSAKARALEKWFNEQWYETLTGVPSEYMIDMCQKKAYDKRLDILERRKKMNEDNVRNPISICCETCKHEEKKRPCRDCIPMLHNKWERKEEEKPDD